MFCQGIQCCSERIPGRIRPGDTTGYCHNSEMVSGTSLRLSGCNAREMFCDQPGPTAIASSSRLLPRFSGILQSCVHVATVACFGLTEALPAIYSNIPMNVRISQGCQVSIYLRERQLCFAVVPPAVHLTLPRDDARTRIILGVSQRLNPQSVHFEK
jgi:hypothetical protein